MVLPRSNYNFKVLFPLTSQKIRSQITTTLMLSYLHPDPPWTNLLPAGDHPGPEHPSISTSTILLSGMRSGSGILMVKLVMSGKPQAIFFDFDPRNFLPIRPTNTLDSMISSDTLHVAMILSIVPSLSFPFLPGFFGWENKKRKWVFSERHLFIHRPPTEKVMIVVGLLQGLCLIHLLWCLNVNVASRHPNALAKLIHPIHEPTPQICAQGALKSAPTARTPQSELSMMPQAKTTTPFHVHLPQELFIHFCHNKWLRSFTVYALYS